MNGIAKLPVAVLAAAFVLAGCGGSTGTDASGLQSENRDLRQENGRLNEEVQRLQGEVERLQSEVEDARETAEAEQPETPVTPQEEEVQETGPEESPGGALAVAGPADLRGEPAPGIMPEDFPLPADAILSTVSEDYYSFNLDFALDTDLQAVTSFYDQRLGDQGWEPADRTEYEQDGLEGTETTWERGTFIPAGSPDDPNYEQVKETLNITLQEIEPSGVAGRLFWSDAELLDENYQDGENGNS